MLIKPKTYDNPSFVIGPVNNNRTAWRPFGLPAVLIVPFANSLRSARGNVSNVRIYIEDVPQYALVAGHDHIGQRYPDRELFAVNVTGTELAAKRIDVSSYLIYVGETDELIDIADAAAKHDEIVEYRFDTFEYTSATGITFRLPYLPDAEYYDLSDIQIETESLPLGHYNLVYQATYHPRVMNVADRRELSCILAGTAVTKTAFHLNHPGEVIAEMVRMTPDILMDGPKSTNQNIGLYRIFADILNDVYDEYGLLRSLTWADSAPYELLPYLGAMLGWDLPYFPNSKDNLRRATLVSIDQLQRLKGSKQALQEIFRLFGFDIKITPVWWSEDGKTLLRPNESAIKLISETASESMLFGYTDSGFGGLNIPLLYRPSSAIQVEFIEVTVGSDAEALVADGSLDGIAEVDGFIGYSKLSFDSLGSSILDIETVDNPPVLNTGVRYNRKYNTVSVTFNGYKEFNGTALYAYATYDHEEYEVPEALRYNRSNRFSLQILKPDGTEIPPDLLDFVIDFVYKVKAFHSLLDVLKLNLTLTDVYQVGDFCVGGNIQQRSDVDAGKLQVPPAILPTATVDSDCENLSPSTLGYKQSDIQLRTDVLTGLLNEYLAWKAYNGRTADSGDHLVPENDGGSDLEYNRFGQDRRVPGTSSTVAGYVTSPSAVSNTEDRGEAFPGDLIPKSETGSSRNATPRFGQYTTEYDQFTPVESSDNDYCYKGRVADELLYQLRNVHEERFLAQTKPHGSGTYWTYPVPTKIFKRGVLKPAKNSRTRASQFSADAKSPNDSIRSALAEGLTQDYGKKLKRGNISYLGQLLRAYDVPKPVSLHYSDRDDVKLSQKENLALVRPSIDATIPYQHFPGCRFATQYALKENFTHAEWKAKPWDFVPTMACDSYPCSGQFTYLNFSMSTGTDGDDVLTFDDVAYSLTANGLTPDIYNNGEHNFDEVTFTADEVVHSVYSGYESRSYDDFEGVTCVEPGTITEVSNKLFDTARDDGPTIIDYIDGYPAESGYFSATSSILSDVVTEDVRDGLRIPDDFSGTLAFRNISGILVGHGHRLSRSLRLTCLTETFSHDIPTVEYIDNDDVEATHTLVPEDSFCSTYQNDGSLTNNLLLLDHVPKIRFNYESEISKPFGLVVTSESISWEPAYSVIGYQIQGSIDGETWRFVNTFTSDTSCLIPDGLNYFRVRSVKYNKYSEWIYSY